MEYMKEILCKLYSSTRDSTGNHSFHISAESQNISETLDATLQWDTLENTQPENSDVEIIQRACWKRWGHKWRAFPGTTEVEVSSRTFHKASLWTSPDTSLFPESSPSGSTAYMCSCMCRRSGKASEASTQSLQGKTSSSILRSQVLSKMAVQKLFSDPLKTTVFLNYKTHFPLP